MISKFALRVRQLMDPGWRGGGGVGGGVLCVWLWVKYILQIIVLTLTSTLLKGLGHERNNFLQGYKLNQYLLVCGQMVFLNFLLASLKTVINFKKALQEPALKSLMRHSESRLLL